MFDETENIILLNPNSSIQYVIADMRLGLIRIQLKSGRLQDAQQTLHYLLNTERFQNSEQIQLIQLKALNLFLSQFEEDDTAMNTYLIEILRVANSINIAHFNAQNIHKCMIIEVEKSIQTNCSGSCKNIQKILTELVEKIKSCK